MSIGLVDTLNASADIARGAAAEKHAERVTNI